VAIGDPNTLDALGLEPGTDNVLLVITDDMDWSDPVAHLNALQQKIGAYIAFIQSGQIAKSMPEAAGRQPKIGVIQQFEPPENIVPLLDGIGAQLSGLGVELGYGPLPDGYEQS
jgi:hypothetical protein